MRRDVIDKLAEIDCGVEVSYPRNDICLNVVDENDVPHLGSSPISKQYALTLKISSYFHAPASEYSRAKEIAVNQLISKLYSHLYEDLYRAIGMAQGNEELKKHLMDIIKSIQPR